MTQNQTHSSIDLDASLNVIEIKPGRRFSEQVLRDWLPDVETLLFFGKCFELDHQQVSTLLRLLFKTSLVDALTSGDHSYDLQDYVLDLAYQAPAVTPGDIVFAPVVLQGEVLPEVWKSLEIEVAQSIKDVAAKMASVVGMLPGKKGTMLFRTLHKANRLRPTIGTYEAQVHHAPQKKNLVILDDSSSVSRSTIRAIVDDVVALAYEADAAFALVSYTTRYWEPGAYSTDAVMDANENGGTQYETLQPLLDRDWGVVICVADYDSSWSAKEHIARNCTGHIDEVLDVSLVNKPTFLAECVGQLADHVRPILIGNSPYVLS